MKEKIEKAIEYLKKISESGHQITDDDKNNAANIYADTYNDYLEIWEAVKEY